MELKTTTFSVEVEALFAKINRKILPFSMTPEYKIKLAGWTAYLGIEAVDYAIGAIGIYWRGNEKGECTKEAAEHMLSMIKRIAGIKKEEIDHPEFKFVTEIMRSLRSRLSGSYPKPYEVAEMAGVLKKAILAGVEQEKLKQITYSMLDSWHDRYEWETAVNKLVKKRAKELLK